jgi:hypothetical protein
VRRFGLLALPDGWQVRWFDLSIPSAVAKPRPAVMADGDCYSRQHFTTHYTFADLVRSDGAGVGLGFLLEAFVDPYQLQDPEGITVVEWYTVHTRCEGFAGTETRLPDKESVMLALLAMGGEYE